MGNTSLETGKETRCRAVPDGARETGRAVEIFVLKSNDKHFF